MVSGRELFLRKVLEDKTLRNLLTLNLSYHSVIEVNIGILCSCLLTLPPLIKLYWPKQFRASVTRLLPNTFGTRAAHQEQRAPTKARNNKHFAGDAWARVNNPQDLNHIELEYRRLNGNPSRTERDLGEPYSNIELDHDPATVV